MKIRHPLLLRTFLAFLVLSVMAVLIFFGSRSALKTLYPLRYTEFVETYSKENNLSDSFVYAVIKCESGFKPNAKSNKNAVGLMQITEETFNDVKKMLGDDDLSFSVDATDEELNIKYGTYYLRFLNNYFSGDEIAVIAAYNAGLGNVQKWLGKDKKLSESEIEFAETKAYVKKVLKAKNIYKNVYEKRSQDV